MRVFRRILWMSLGMFVLWFLSSIHSVHAQILPSTSSFQTSFTVQDGDGDGVSDAWEALFQTDPHAIDTDHDGHPDAKEIALGFSPKGVGRWQETDHDQDRLNDRLEFLFASNPEIQDTDGDGYTDGQEISSGYSPTSTSREPLSKRIEIQLSSQELRQVLGGVVLATYTISSGKPGMSTPVGDFTVLSKHPRAWSRRAGLWMPWWMQFTKQGHGIHELPEWPGGYKEGAAHLGKPVSHGCVRLGIGPAKTLYAWAEIGTTISIRR